MIPPDHSSRDSRMRLLDKQTHSILPVSMKNGKRQVKLRENSHISLFPILVTHCSIFVVFPKIQMRGFSSVQSLSRVRLFVTPWIAACQASLSITNSQSSLKLMSIKLVMPSSHLILCYPLLLLPPIPPSIRVFSNESTLRTRWPKYWSFSFSIIPSKEISGLISLQSKGPSRVFSNTTVQKHQFFGAQPSSQSNSHIHTWPLEKP